MGLKSGRGQGTFIDGLLGAIDTFYAEVLQSLKAWAAKPPRMREQTDTSELAKDQEVPPALVATALSSQDGPTLDEAESLSAESAQEATAPGVSYPTIAPRAADEQKLTLMPRATIRC